MRRGIVFLFSSLIVAVTSFAMDGAQSNLIESVLNDGCATRVNEQPLQFPSSCMTTFLEPTDVDTVLVPKRLRDWGSNGLDGHAWKYSDDNCNNFFMDLFASIAIAFPAIKLTPHDLFHGHLMKHGNDELAAVFHAKEYPADVEVIKNNYQIPSESFVSTDDEFDQRNFLFLNQDLFLIENRGPCASYFDETQINSLCETRIAEGLEDAKTLGDVNLFMPASLSRIKYNFCSGINPETNKLVPDYEGLLTGKSVKERWQANAYMDVLISFLQGKPLLYFLTGR